MENKIVKLSRIISGLGLYTEGNLLNKLCIAKSFDYLESNIIVKKASCKRDFIKLASFLSKTASTYYGKAGAGILLICKEDSTALLLRRSKNVEQPLTWGIPGGAVTEGWHDSDDINGEDVSDQSFKETAIRETREELFSEEINDSDFESTFKSLFNDEDLVGQTEFRDGGFVYKTFIYNITLDEKRKITPLIKLNWENTKAKWYSLSSLPSDLHPGLNFTKQNLKERKVNIFKENKDEFDWLRSWLESLKLDVGEIAATEIDKYILEVDQLPKKEDVIKQTSVWDADRRFERNKFTKELLTRLARKLSELSERKAAVKVLNFSASTFPYQNTKYDSLRERSLETSPRSEFSSHAGFFYHSTPLQNAISILKSKCFVGAGAFTRLSLTTDLLLSGKFGDVIFVFDAAKLQRQGAKKMNYGNRSRIRGVEKNLEISGKKVEVDENNLDYPWISDIYKVEKEWVLKLPFCFSDQLKKIIYFSRDSNSDSAKKVFSILDNLTEVPVEIMGYPSIGENEPSESKDIPLIQADITGILYRDVFSKQANFEDLKRQYDRESEKRLRYEDYKADLGFLYRNDPIKKLLFFIKTKSQDIGSLARQLSFESIYDSGRVGEYYKEILSARVTANDMIKSNSYVRDMSWIYNFENDQQLIAFVNPYLENIVSICNKILSSEEDFKKMIRAKHFGNSEIEPEVVEEKEKYIVTHFVYPSGAPRLILDRARQWCSQNIGQILSIQNMKDYLNEHGPKVWGSDWSWYSKDKLDDYSISSKIEDLLKEANPSQVSDQKFVENFLAIIDNDSLEKIPDERLTKISKEYLDRGTPKYSGGEKYSADWIKSYRYPYASEGLKKKLQVIIKSLGGTLDEDDQEA